MKKNIAMRIAAFLFILTMISTCAFATTFAKYTTSESATDSARVAKWGVEVIVTGNDAFKTDYTTDDKANYTGANSVSAKAVAEGDTRESLVAPGTNGTLFTYSISGTPEVATKVTVDFDLTLSNWKVEATEYCPLVFTVGETKIQMDGTNNTVALLEAAVEAAVNNQYNCNANQSLANSITVSWAWAFEGAQGSVQTDELDTALGSLGTAPQIIYSIEVTVEQID